MSLIRNLLSEDGDMRTISLNSLCFWEGLWRMFIMRWEHQFYATDMKRNSNVFITKKMKEVPFVADSFGRKLHLYSLLATHMYTHTNTHKQEATSNANSMEM